MQPLARLSVPPTIILGGGARHELVPQLERLALRRPLLVTDPGVVELGFAEPLASALTRAGLSVQISHEVQPDPTLENVEAVLAAARRHEADVLVALGGGSPIDAAKAAALLMGNPGPLGQYRGYHRVPRAGLPVVAIPTTAGTGSEVTQVAVITDPATQVKMMVLDAHLVPRVALVDFELSLSMPRPLTAAVGVDTLTHGIEAYVSRQAQPLTDPLALACIGLVGRHLVRAYDQPSDALAREGMMAAACQGGMAFANASVALVHGMSRPLGAVYHLPHGLSNAVLLPAVTAYSLSGATARYATVARALGCATQDDDDPTAAGRLVPALEHFNQVLAVPRLRECLGVSQAHFESTLEKMAHDALQSGSPQNNPRVPAAGEIVELYRQAW